MRTYSKPIVEIENFRLDAQFASGGCAGVTVPQSDLDQLAVGLEAYLKEGAEQTDFVAEFVALFEGGLSWENYERESNKYLNDFYWFDFAKRHGDNPTSGPCYFTYSNASGKSFS